MTQPQSQNLTYKCSTVIAGNPFILGSKGQRHESQKQCRHGCLHSCECWLLPVMIRFLDMTAANHDTLPMWLMTESEAGGVYLWVWAACGRCTDAGVLRCRPSHRSSMTTSASETQRTPLQLHTLCTPARSQHTHLLLLLFFGPTTQFPRKK